MAFLDKPTDTELPKPNSTLSDWRFFFAVVLDLGHPAFAYLDYLCNKFGGDYEIETDPIIFKDHVLWVASTNEHEAYLKSQEKAIK